MDEKSLVSNAFQVFLRDAPQHAQAWGSSFRTWLRRALWMARPASWPTSRFSLLCTWRAVSRSTFVAPSRPVLRVRR